jgi:hypothetical protein
MGDCSVLAGRAEVLRGDGLVSNGAMSEAQRNFLSSSRRSSIHCYKATTGLKYWLKVRITYTGINIGNGTIH